MQLTVELPDALAERLNSYLKEHPEETILIQDALAAKLVPKDNAALLKLAGIVSDAPRDARDRAEDYE